MSQDKVALVLDNALAVSDLKCNQYFTALGAAQQGLGFARRETTLVGGATAAFLGLAGATSKAIANTATLFALGIASLDTYESAYLFSPDVGAVKELVYRATRKFRDELKPGDVQDFPTVARVVSDYEELCQVHTIRRLVNQSVAAAKVEGEQALAEAIYKQNILTLANAVGAKHPLSEDDITLLYWLVVGSPAAEEVKKQKSRIDMIAGGIVDDKGAIPSDVRAKILAAFALFTAKDRKEFDDDLAALKKRMAEGAIPAKSDQARARASGIVTPKSVYNGISIHVVR